MFRMDELLLIENLTYLKEDYPLPGILDSKGKTVEEMLGVVNIDELEDEKEYQSFVNGFDWKNLILAMRSNKAIMNTRIVETHYDDAYGGGGGVSALFINDSYKEAVVAFRGTALNEWTDDFVGGNAIDSLQQINALEWYKKIYEEFGLDKYNVTVTGHSKGGNKAKYITLLNDTVKRCVSFDGQGFSDKFIEFYRDQIIARQDFIENHNIDFDYVNILLNDVGKKFYYYGYDYGKGGFAEAHCPNTFFDFKEDGKYSIRLNPNGQRPEMQILDQFMNSMVRSAISEKEKNESNELVGMLVEKAFMIGQRITVNEFISFMFDIIGTEKYSNNAAYLLVYCIKYARNVPEFLDTFKSIMLYFKMDDVISIIEMLKDFVLSKKVGMLLSVSNFLVLHANGFVVKRIQHTAKKKYNVDLTKEQIRKALVVISMASDFMKTLELDMDGSDIVVEDIPEEDEYELPEDMNVVILAGGLSNERNRSLRCGFSVKDALKDKHKVILLDAFMGYGEEEETIEDAFAEIEKYSLHDEEIPDDIPDLWAVKKRRKDQSNSYFGPNVIQILKQADLVFIALQGANGENGKIQATLDLLGIDYTGCRQFGSALSSNKDVAKQVMSNHGIPVAKGICIRKTDRLVPLSKYDISFPVIVKPCNGGIGLGISIANDQASYKKAINNAFRWDNQILVEEYIQGREFSVGTLDGKPLPVLESLPLSINDKTLGKTLSGNVRHICPAQIDPKLAKTLQDTAVLASSVIGLKAYSHTDFIVKEDGSFVCLECDSLPDLSEDSQFVLAAAVDGITYKDLCEKIITISMKH